MSPSKAKHPFERRYFTSYPVENEKEAAWFSKRPTFSIMDLLWEAGPKGLTPANVCDSLKDVSRTVVYQTLKGLYESDKVDREWDKEAEAHRNVLTERSPPAILDEELERLPDRDEYPGILEFCHQGCAIYSYLVVNGPTYGTIWDGRVSP